MRSGVSVEQFIQPSKCENSGEKSNTNWIAEKPVCNWIISVG